MSLLDTQSFGTVERVQDRELLALDCFDCMSIGSPNTQRPLRWFFHFRFRNFIFAKTLCAVKIHFKFKCQGLLLPSYASFNIKRLPDKIICCIEKRDLSGISFFLFGKGSDMCYHLQWQSWQSSRFQYQKSVFEIQIFFIMKPFQRIKIFPRA